MTRTPNITNRLTPGTTWITNLALCFVACMGASLITFGCVSGKDGSTTSEQIVSLAGIPNATDAQLHLAAAEANRLRLWEDLKKDELVIPPADFDALQELYGQATFLSAQIAVGLEGPRWPTEELVEEWIIQGSMLYDGVDEIMTRIGGDLSVGTRSAWAVEQVRLRKLTSIGKAYIDNPNSQTYQQLLKVGIVVGRSVLGAALL